MPCENSTRPTPDGRRRRLHHHPVLSGLVGAATAVWQIAVLRAGAWTARGLGGGRPCRAGPGRRGQPVGDDATATTLLDRLGQAAQGPAAGLPELAAWQATALAERTRHQGRPDPAAWATAVAAWERLAQPYRVAYAGFRQAEALLATTGDRDTATVVLRHAAASRWREPGLAGLPPPLGIGGERIG